MAHYDPSDNVKKENDVFRYDLNERIDLLKMSQAINLIGSWEWDLKTDKILWTDAMFELRAIPITADHLVTWEENYNFIHPDDREMVKQNFESLNKQKEASFEYRIIPATGEVKIIRAWARIVKNKDNEPIFLQGTSQDITKEREAENKLKELNIMLEHAEEMVNIGNWQWNRKTRKLSCSDNLYRMLDYKPQEFYPAPKFFLKFIPEEDKEKIKEYFKTSLVNPNSSTLELRIILHEGQQKYLRSKVKVFKGSEGEDIIIGTFHDITDEVVMRKEFEERTTLAEMLIENNVDMIAAYDTDFRFIAWNKKCEEKYGYKKADVLGKHISEIFIDYDDAEIRQQLEEAKKGKIIHYKDRKYRSSDGYYESFIIPLENKNNIIFGILVITHDLTNIKNTTIKLNEVNQSLRQKNEEFERSNKELASFSYIASHDLQEPLRKIQIFSNRILDKEYAGLSIQGKEYLKRMSFAAERMQILIDDLLAFSRTNTAPRIFEKVDLNEMLRLIESDLKDSIDETHAIIEYKNLPVINVIAFQFKQLLENLILNSLKYHKPKTPPKINISNEFGSSKEFGLEGVDDLVSYHKIVISDNGIGFPQQYAEKIFELFQRLHGKHEYPGTGLGLAICKRIVQNHGGSITADSKPGEGATFTIFLPVYNK